MIARNPEISVPLSDDLRAFVEGESQRAGFDDPSEYIRSLIEDVRRRRVLEPASSPTSGASSVLQLARDIAATVPDEEWQRVPADLAANFDHYNYGAPRVPE